MKAQKIFWVVLLAVLCVPLALQAQQNKDWRWNMINKSWTERFEKHEKTIKNLVQDYKRQVPDSSRAKEVHNALLKEIESLRQDQIDMQKENLQLFKDSINELQSSYAESKRGFFRDFRTMSVQERSAQLQELNQMREVLNKLQVTRVKLSMAISKESKQLRKKAWAIAKTLLVIKKNADMNVFFDGDSLFSEDWMGDYYTAYDLASDDFTPTRGGAVSADSGADSSASFSGGAAATRSDKTEFIYLGPTGKELKPDEDLEDKPAQ